MVLLQNFGGAFVHLFGLVAEPIGGVGGFLGGGVADVFVAFLAADDFALAGVGEFAEFALVGFARRFVEFDEELGGGEPHHFLIDHVHHQIDRRVRDGRGREIEFGLEGGDQGVGAIED